jgi:hypothetical protein
MNDASPWPVNPFSFNAVIADDEDIGDAETDMDEDCLWKLLVI